MRLASLAAAVRHDRPDVGDCRTGRNLHDAVRVGAMAETILGRPVSLSESAGALFGPRVCQVDPRLCVGRVKRKLSYSR